MAAMPQLPDRPPELECEGAIRLHVERICASEAMARSVRSQQLLRHLVKAYLDGVPVKEHTLALDLFDRGPDYDPKIDSIVRTEVNRLRARLHKFYEAPGSAADIRLEIPKGAYAVKMIPSQPADVETPRARPSGKPGTRRRRWAVAVAAVILMIVALSSWMASRSRQLPDQVFRSQLVPPEGSQIDPDRGFAISPDGRMLAFVAITRGQSGLWVRSMGDAAARLLPGTVGARDPFWSPGSLSVAYTAAGKLWRANVVDGGSAIAVSDAISTSGGAWATGGTIIFSTGTGGLRRVSASGGASESFTRPDTDRGETSHRWPQVLSSERILFQVSGSREVSGIYAAKLANPRDRVRLVPAEGNAVYAAGHLLWLRGSTLVAQQFHPERLALSGELRPIADRVGVGTFGRMLAAASSSGLLVHVRSGGDQLTWVDRAGKVVGVSGPPGGYLPLRLSPDGKRIAVGRTSGAQTNLWILDVERDGGSRFTFMQGGVGFPVWSPDSRQVMYRAGSPRNLYRKEATGAGTEQRVTQSANPQWPGDWSRNGRLVLYYEDAPDTHRDLWVLPVTPEGIPDAAAKPYPYVRTRFNEFNGRFSPQPNPRWVAYQSDESGVNEVYVRTFPEPRGKWQISTSGGTSPEWSSDGRQLYYVSDSGKLMAAALDLGPDSVTATASHELFAMPSRAAEQRYAVAPDGRRFLVEVPAGGSQPMELVVNWPALLRQGVAHAN